MYIYSKTLKEVKNVEKVFFFFKVTNLYSGKRYTKLKSMIANNKE